MKRKTSLLGLRSSRPLNLGLNLIGGRLGLDPAVAKNAPERLGENIANLPPLKGGESPRRSSERAGEADMHGGLVDGLFGHKKNTGRKSSGPLMAIIPEGDNGKDVTIVKLMDIGPEDGQKYDMAKAPAKSLKTPADYSEKVHKFYAQPEEVAAAKALARLNEEQGRRHTSLSALIANELRKMIRVNATRLRKAGVKLPAAIFQK